MTPELESYIAQCRASGLSDDAIKSTLLSGGWTEDQFGEAFGAPARIEIKQNFTDAPQQQVSQPVEVKKRPRGLRRAMLLTGATLGGLIFLSGGMIALGESGYAPVVSRTYRQTDLPLLWQGTNDNAALNLGRAIINSVEQPQMKIAETFDITITEVSEGMAEELGIKRLVPKRSENSLAAVQDSATEDPMQIKGSFAFTLHDEKGTRLEFGLDLDTDWINSFAGNYLKPNAGLSLEGIFPSVGQHLFFRSNALPSPKESDKNRWLAYDMEDSVSLQEVREEIKEFVLGDDEFLKEYEVIINTLSKDMGIVRRNGGAVAWYRTTINKAGYETLSQNQELSEYTRENFAYMVEDEIEGEIVIDWYLDARNPLVREAVISGGLGFDYGTFEITSETVITYGEITNFEVPNLADAWASFEEYEEAVREAHPNYADTGIFTQEALDYYMEMEEMSMNSNRMSDVVELGKAIETYKVNKEVDSPPANTNGVYERLDQEGCVLCTIPDFPFHLPLSPDPAVAQGIYISYWSNGTSYRVITPLLASDGTISGYFMVQDAETSETTTLP